MERTLANFIRALRASEVRISTAETLDAFRTAEIVGWRDRAALKEALAVTLPKTRDEKEAFDACFDTFFRFEAFQDQPPAENDAAEAPDEADQQSQPGDGESGGGGGDPQQRGGGGEAPARPFEGNPEAHSEAEDAADLEELLHPGELSEARSALGRLLMEADRTETAVQISNAAGEVGVENIQFFTQKGVYTRKIMDAMGNAELQDEIIEAGRGEDIRDRRLGQELRRRREALREQIRDYVERQFLLHADVKGDRLREEILRKAKLSFVDQRNFRHLRRLVRKMAKKLVAAYSRKRKITKRGALHVPRTLRKNLRHDGNLIELQWKSTKIEKPRVFAICDVSGSVANYARFMLMFLYSLEEVLPNVRAFAFSSDLGEVTELFARNELEEAVAHTIADYAGGSTDYGQAFADFERLAGDDLDNRATVIILGDARNNYGNPRTDLLRKFYDRSRRVIWLNPEPEMSWGSGDSEMPRYRAHVHQAEVCNSLIHLERVVSNLLRTTA
ncbi:MAG: VWA domain-containing protein [Pseudomonadales bacterium]|nr:VWA domain-containing protein [Pseudomonadales bacterium]